MQLVENVQPLMLLFVLVFFILQMATSVEMQKSGQVLQRAYLLYFTVFKFFELSMPPIWK